MRVLKEELSRRAEESRKKMLAGGTASEGMSETEEDPEKVDWLKRNWDEYQAYINFDGSSEELQKMLEKTRESMRKYEEEHARRKRK